MIDATHELDVVLDAENPSIARAAALALAVETKDPPSNTHVTVRAEGEKILLRFEGVETRGLRAAVHSYLRLADVAIAAARRATA